MIWVLVPVISGIVLIILIVIGSVIEIIAERKRKLDYLDFENDYYKEKTKVHHEDMIELRKELEGTKKGLEEAKKIMCLLGRELVLHDGYRYSKKYFKYVIDDSFKVTEVIHKEIVLEFDNNIVKKWCLYDKTDEIYEEYSRDRIFESRGFAIEGLNEIKKNLGVIK